MEPAGEPAYADVYLNRGIAYSEKGLHDLAIKDYTRAIELRPDDTRAYHNRGLAHSEKDLYDLAIKDYTRAIKLKPGSAQMYLDRSTAYVGLTFCQGRFEALDLALQDCSKAIRLESDRAEAYSRRGLIYRMPARDTRDAGIARLQNTPET